MADSWEPLLEVCANGIHATGIAASADAFDNASDCLIIAQSVENTVSLNTVAADPKVQSIVAAGIAFLVADHRRLEVAKVRFADVRSERPLIRIPTKTDVEQAVLIMSASKVNWFQTNHHTGQGKPSGFYAKCLAVVGIKEANDNDLHMLWKMCHWASTSAVLRAFKVRGNLIIRQFAEGTHIPAWCIPTDTHADVWPAASRDISLRISSYPSGTALHAIILRSCHAIAGSFYARVVPRDVVTAFRALCVTCDNILNDPCRFHVGSHFLTGNSQILLDPPSATLQGIAHAYLTVVIPDTSLGKSPTIHRLEQNTTLISAYTAIKTSILRSGKKVTDVIASITAGSFGGDAFASDEVYDEQIREVAAIRDKTRVRAVSDDEEE